MSIVRKDVVMTEIDETDDATQAEHERELFRAQSPTRSIRYVNAVGWAQAWTRFGTGVTFDSTASNGGFHPDAAANAVLPAA
jgi:hypothetical protein